MKKTLLLFSLFCTLIISASADVWNENFDDQKSNSYTATSYEINGRTWTASDAGNFSYCNTSMGSYGFTINDDKAGAHITTPVLNTLGTVSFKYAYKNGSNSNVFLIQTSNDGVNFSTIDTHTLGADAEESWVNYAYNINSTSATTYLKILSDDQNAHLFIDDFSVTSNGGAALPSLTLSTSSITDLHYEKGKGASESQSFTVSGTDLSSEITLSSDTNFELSIDNSTFQSSLTLEQSAGSVPETIIYVRLISGLEIGLYDGKITCTSADATNKLVNLSGQVQGAQTTTLPYSEDFSNGQGKIYIYDAGGDDAWIVSNEEISCNGYPNDDAIDIDWLILPGIDLSTASNAKILFSTWWKYGNDDADNYLQLKYSTNYVGFGEPSNATWTSLSFNYSEEPETYLQTEAIDLSSIKESHVYIAFVYKSDESARQWKIDNISITGDQTTVMEPSNHVTNFNAATGEISETTIDLAWNEVDGTALATGYLIVASTDSIASPSNNKMPLENDLDLTDGSGNVTVQQGTNNYTFDNCAEGTTYNFSIFPFIQTNDTIVYKTADAPSTEATTNTFPIINPVTELSASVVSSSEIALMWELNSNNDSIIIVSAIYNEITDSLVEGENYKVGDLLNSGANVIYIGTDTSFNHSNLEASAYYYYKIWSYKGNKYSEPTVAQTATLSPEPTNSVIGYSVQNQTTSSATLTWDSQTAETDPDGYLLLISTDENNLQAPIDGTDIEGDSDLSDGNGATKVAFGDTTYIWHNLAPETVYYFAIYPYTNSEAFIDYKIEGASIISTTTESGIAPPIITPESGNYTDSIAVTITCPTANASIFYTLDGSEPDANSLFYQNAIILTDTTMINAISIFENEISEIITKTFNISQSPITIETPTINPNGGEYNDSIEITITCNTPGAEIWYGINSIELIQYEGPFTLSESATITTAATVDPYLSDVNEASFIIIPAPIEVATPIISPEAGEFSDSVEVSISCVTDQAVIYYTTDGTIPNDSSLVYEVPFTLYTQAEVQAIAYVDTFNSEVTSANYMVIETVKPEEVITLAELRAGQTDGTIYHFSGEAVVTYVSNLRGQKFIQDETAAILIDDNNKIISETFAVGDGISDLTGVLYDYYGMLEFIPTASTTPINSSKTVEPKSLSFEEFNTNFKDYESQLITLNDHINFGDITFANGKDYTVTDNTNTVIIRANFYDADYIGTSTSNNWYEVTGLAIWHYDEPKLAPRNSKDINFISAVGEYEEELKIYSNQHLLTIEGASNYEFVSIFNIAGQKVYSSNLDDNVQFNIDKNGVYIVVLNGKSIKTKKITIQ